ncbi:MAG: hemerythrin domain-containing protein [Planctomycetes bacterium]|nr:hemerythrin domain-containing protein [Planctomycetota bacterium]MBI3845618.1 hemerythrin domain-containing protein [Planctomycetota bacterium]
MSSVKSTATWSSATDVVKHILDVHHPFVRAELPKLADLAARMGNRTVEQLVAAIADGMSTHMMKEEQILFPSIVELEQAAREKRAPHAMLCGAEGPIAQMKAEHDEARATLILLLKACDEAPYRAIRERLIAFQTDLEAHAGLEETVLFPWAIRLFDAA